MTDANIDLEHVEEDTPPPGLEGGFTDVLRKNLFKDVPNSIFTIVAVVAVAYLAYKAVGFMFFNNKAIPESAGGGTRSAWTVIREPLEFYMVGTRFSDTGISFAQLWAAIYLLVFTLAFATSTPPPPADAEQAPPMSLAGKISIAGPPILAAIIILAFTQTVTPKILTVLIAVPFVLGQLAGRRLPDALGQRKGMILGILTLVVVLVEGGYRPELAWHLGLPEMLENIDRFGGLLLTVNVAFISIALCFPIGVIMALLRRSTFVLLRPLAVAYIELIRGVPLITLLFMGQFALGFFLPDSVDPPPVIRAIIMVTLFSGAYVAEIVRGGLQSVPGGQTEAGQAVGLNPVTITRKIVLPQALRNSIPALVGQFIALLKDTTLLIIIGLFDLLGVSDPILASPNFQNQGYAPEVYAFVAFLFWVMCFSMSRASQRLETRLGVGTR